MKAQSPGRFKYSRNRWDSTSFFPRRFPPWRLPTSPGHTLFRKTPASFFILHPARLPHKYIYIDATRCFIVWLTGVKKILTARQDRKHFFSRAFLQDLSSARRENLFSRSRERKSGKGELRKIGLIRGKPVIITCRVLFIIFFFLLTQYMYT